MTAPIVVQVITTRWTKASRGQPGAGRRTAVPDVLPLRAPAGDAIVVETVSADEEHAFALVRSTSAAAALPLRIASVLIEDVDGAVRVTRRREVGTGWPSRPSDVVACSLDPGQWGQVVTNHRHSGYAGWSYDKIVVNVARPRERVADVFATAAVRRLDEQESLF